MTDITVQYERKLSDGNYGSEGLSFSTTYTLEGEPMTEEEFAAVLAFQRRCVLGQLAHSEARNVAFAAQRELNPPPPRAPAGPAAPTASLEDAPF